MSNMDHREGKREERTRPECPSTAEAVLEYEDMGEVGCPLCGRAAMWHDREDGCTFHVQFVSRTV